MFFEEKILKFNHILILIFKERDFKKVFFVFKHKGMICLSFIYNVNEMKKLNCSTNYTNYIKTIILLELISH
jgi:hypothetical protein